MKATDVLSLIGGLALFLYGMQMMSSGLEAAAGNRMKRILERLTSNRFLGVAVGAGITAAIQSSSATTVMVVGFVNSGMMTLGQAVWVIMGANIGTTITGQLIALDVGMLAPLFAFAGVAMVVFLKNPKVHHYGQILAGLGVLFIGMDMMSSSMMPLRDSPAFVQLMTTVSNPVLGIIAGAIFTAVIQSSSASIGILQALASSGLVSLPSAVFILFGQNIGTCITALLASVGTSRGAKRATLIHLIFNVFGTTLFTIICVVTPLTALVEGFTPNNPSFQIANMHTLFNVTTTLLLLPLGTFLAKLSVRLLPDRQEDIAKEKHLMYLNPLNAGVEQHRIGTSAIRISQLQQEVARMMKMAMENVSDGFQAVLDGDPAILERVDEKEDYIDFLNKEISQFISKIIVHESNEHDSATISAYFLIIGNIERIGDHAINICGYTQILEEKNIRFSDKARLEIQEMKQVCSDTLEYLHQSEGGSVECLTKIAKKEQLIDDMTVKFRENQLERIRSGSCSEEACIIYSEMLTDFERIGDHSLNIAQELSKIDPGLKL